MDANTYMAISSKSEQQKTTGQLTNTKDLTPTVQSEKQVHFYYFYVL